MKTDKKQPNNNVKNIPRVDKPNSYKNIKDKVYSFSKKFFKRLKSTSSNDVIACFTVLILLYYIISFWETNKARISVFDAKFKTFRTLSYDSPYLDSISSFRLPPEPSDQPNIIMIKFAEVAISKGTNTPIAYGLTKSDVIKELSRSGQKDTLMEYWKIFIPQISIENFGHTTATIDSIVIYNFHMDSTQNVQALDSSRILIPENNFSLEPDQTFISAKQFFKFDKYIPNFQYNLTVYYNGDWFCEGTKKVIVKYIAGFFYIGNQ